VDYLPKTKMYKHQEDIFYKTRDKEYYALLLEMGVGKTKITLDTGCWLYNNGKIDAVLVIAPSGVNRNWVINEIPVHVPDYCNVMSAWYSSSPTKSEESKLKQTLDHNYLKIVTINIEALATQKGFNFVKNFLLAFRSLFVLDESTVIKSPKAVRTKNILKLAKHAPYRRILTGTPVTNSPMDIYCQFQFLDPTILHTSSFYAFRNRYAIMKEMRTAGRSFMNVVGYTNLDELQTLIAPHSYRVTKSECLDLPEKLYTKRYVTLSESQRKLYNSLKKDIVAEFNGMVMSSPLALTKLLRLQQIVGGFFQPDQDIVQEGSWDANSVHPSRSGTAIDLAWNDGLSDHQQNYVDHHGYTTYDSRIKLKPQAIDKVNLRVESLIELLEETNGKVIIWARFRAEISEIASQIQSKFGRVSCVEYHGGVNNEDRGRAIFDFQNNPDVRFFIGHVQAGGKGLTLHAATTVVYYSNDFSLENRLQSEDRCHRIGQKHNVTYVDMIAQGTLDEKIVETLRNKKSVADLITGDEPIENWV